MAHSADPVGRARRSSGAGWWVAAAVAAIAAVGLVAVLQVDKRRDLLQASRAPSATEPAGAEHPAVRADQAAQQATDSSARATRRAAEAAQRAADEAAQSASDAAQDAAAAAPAQHP